MTGSQLPKIVHNFLLAVSFPSVRYDDSRGSATPLNQYLSINLRCQTNIFYNYFAIRFVYKMFLEEKFNVKFVVYFMVNINVKN